LRNHEHTRNSPDYTRFLEHLVGVLLKNVTNPEGYVKTELVFYQAWDKLEAMIKHHKEQVQSLSETLDVFHVTKHEIDKVRFGLFVSNQGW